ncbi:MAG: DUF2130 domain-containing protein [Terriglobia bacterium]
MAKKAKYRCPLCKKPLTKKEFDRALRIHEARQEHVEHDKRQLELDKREFEAHKKQLTKSVKEKAREEERARSRRILEGKDRDLTRLRERVKLLQKGKAPQDEGPEFEVKLLKRLRDAFPDDDVQHKGKAGDVLHIVNDGSKATGVIIYECKWTPRISGSHVRQTARAKMSRHADYAVLVTSGTKPGFKGLAEISGVLVVAPAGVLPLVALLRKHLIGMFRAGIEKRRRARIANQLLKFIKSPEFKNPIEEVISTAAELKDSVKEEYRWHMNDWKKRLTAYERIRWDGSAVEENLRRVFRGEATKQMIQPRQKLALPAPAGA